MLEGFGITKKLFCSAPISKLEVRFFFQTAALLEDKVMNWLIKNDQNLISYLHFCGPLRVWVSSYPLKRWNSGRWTLFFLQLDSPDEE